MKYHKTILGQMLLLFSRLEFQSFVKKYNGDHRVRKLRCWDQFVYLLFAQLGKQHSLRDTIDTMNTQQRKLYHFGAQRLTRSTLSDANNKRDYRIYEDLFFLLLKRVQCIAPKYKLKLDRKFYVLDSTTIDLCLQLFPWARFRKNKGAVKIHTLLNVDGPLPEFLKITDGKVHDSTVAKKLNIPPGSYLAIDRAYHDFKQYNSYNNNNIRFVTRKKTNAKYVVIESLKCNIADGVLSDEIVEFTGYQTHKKYPHPIRIIKFLDFKTEKELEFLTNDMKLDALTITQIYKARWEIELFFKTIKQNLKIKRFIGNSPNAVCTQVWIALIAYLLVSYQKFMLKAKYSIQKIFKIIQVNLFERKSLEDLLTDNLVKPPDFVNKWQFCLFES
jgi:hypothetical protein